MPAPGRNREGVAEARAIRFGDFPPVSEVPSTGGRTSAGESSPGFFSVGSVTEPPDPTQNQYTPTRAVRPELSALLALDPSPRCVSLPAGVEVPRGACPGAAPVPRSPPSPSLTPAWSGHPVPAPLQPSVHRRARRKARFLRSLATGSGSLGVSKIFGIPEKRGSCMIRRKGSTPRVPSPRCS